MGHRSPGSFSSGSRVLRSPLGINFDARKERFSFCDPGAEIYSGTWKSGDPSLSRHITSPLRAWSLFHAVFPQRQRPLFVGLGWSLSSLQITCMFYSFTFTSLSRAEGPTLGSALRVHAFVGRSCLHWENRGKFSAWNGYTLGQWPLPVAWCSHSQQLWSPASSRSTSLMRSVLSMKDKAYGYVF